MPKKDKSIILSSTWGVCEIHLRIRYVADSHTRRAIGKSAIEVLQNAGMLAEVVREATLVVPLPDPPVCRAEPSPASDQPMGGGRGESS